MTTVEEIVHHYVRKGMLDHLVDMGYDGLLEEEGECACEIEDLFPCGKPLEEVLSCRGAYKIRCRGDCGLGLECLWHMTVDPNHPDRLTKPPENRMLSSHP